MGAESSRKLASLAASMLDDEDPAVRSLAGSVLRQFEREDEAPSRRMDAILTGRTPEFWEGYWDGLWDCRTHR